MTKDCLVFVHTGFCSFRGNCKFHHPTSGKSQVEKEGSNGNADRNSSEKPSHMIPCKFFQDGICYKGEACEFQHSMPYALPDNGQFNSIGLPYRLGEQECSFYMRNGSCGYGAACKFHHPEPFAYNPFAYNPEMYAQIEANENFEYQYGSSGFNDGGHYPETNISYLQGGQPNFQWNGNQQVYSGNTHGMTSFSRFKGPYDSPSKVTTVSLNEDGLPQRSWKRVCWHYERTGRCRFGQTCGYHHPAKVSSNVGEGSTSKSAPDAEAEETKE